MTQQKHISKSTLATKSHQRAVAKELSERGFVASVELSEQVGHSTNGQHTDLYSAAVFVKLDGELACASIHKDERPTTVHRLRKLAGEAIANLEEEIAEFAEEGSA